mgnify:CR=1 FL=1
MLATVFGFYLGIKLTIRNVIIFLTTLLTFDKLTIDLSEYYKLLIVFSTLIQVTRITVIVNYLIIDYSNLAPAFGG